MTPEYVWLTTNWLDSGEQLRQAFSLKKHKREMDSGPSGATDNSSKTITFVIAGVVVFPALVVIVMICCLFLRPMMRRNDKEQEETEVGDTATICDSIIEMNPLALEDLPLSSYLDTMQRQTV